MRIAQIIDLRRKRDSFFSRFLLLTLLTGAIIFLLAGGDRWAQGEEREALTFANWSDEDGPFTLTWDPVPVITDSSPKSVGFHLENRSNRDERFHLTFSSVDSVVPIDENGNESGELHSEVTVPAGGTSDGSFSFLGKKGTYNAHYPLHLKAKWEGEGGEVRELHAVRVVEFNRPRESDHFQTTIITRGGVSLLGKDYLARYRYRDGEEISLGENFIGSDPESGSDIHQYPIQCDGGTRSAFSIHPPFRPIGGSLYLDFPVRLPDLPTVFLRYGCALRTPTPVEPPSDGVTFRIWGRSREITGAGDKERNEMGEGNERNEQEGEERGEGAMTGAFGEPVLLDEIHTDAKDWVDRTVDLSQFAGQEILLTVEFNTGPKNDSICDSSFMSDLTIFGGEANGITGDGTLGETGVPEGFTLMDEGDAVTFPLVNGFQATITSGKNGFFDGEFSFLHPIDGKGVIFRGMELALEGLPLKGEDPLFVESPRCYRNEKGDRILCRGTFLHEDRLLKLETVAYVENGLLILDLPEGNPVRIGKLRLGPTDVRGERVYASHGVVIDRPSGAFHLVAEGHRLASSHVGFDFENGVSILEGSEIPPDSLDVDPDAGLWGLTISGVNRLAFLPTLSGAFSAAIDFRSLSPWRAQPTPGVARKAGRLVFDDWCSSCDLSRERIEKAFAYGVTDSLFIKHVWQRWGYDVRLPDIWGDSEEDAVLPAIGTLEDLRALADACVSRGVPFALHDNYIDYYPDAEGFSYDKIIFNEDGTPQKAWINYGMETQSYRTRPDRLRPELLRNLEWTRKFLPQTDAYFVDVFTSITQMDFLTREGEFHPKKETRKCWMDAFLTIGDRLAHETPDGRKETAITISEAGSDGLIGGIDGADAQWLGLSETPRAWAMTLSCRSWARTPWFAAVNHSNFIRHGVGYEGRYLAMRDAGLHGIMSDDYLSMEVLGGVDQMVDFGNIFPGSVRKHFLAQHVMRDRIDAEIESVEFDRDGEGINIGRQTVRWSNGDVVYANRHSGDWTVKEGVTIPRYGYYVEDRDGNLKSAIIANPSNPDEVVEFSQDGDSFYLNGRGSEVKKVYAVTPSLGRTEILPDGKFRVEIDWRVEEPIPEGLRTFIHLYEAYLGYGHHPNGWVAGGDSPKIPTERWFSEKDAEEGEVVKTDFDQVLAVPEGILAGRYLVMVGLYDPESGKRLPMMGDDAGETRYAIGELIVKRSDGKTEIEINPLPPDEERNLFFRLRANSTPASFHGISTLGGVVVTPEGDGTWSLLPIPVLSDFEVTLSEKEIGKRVGRIVSRGEEVPFQRDGVNGERVTFHVTAADAIRYQVVFE